MRQRLWSIFLLSLVLMSVAQANDHPYDITFTLPLIAKDPRNLHGYRIATGYQPQLLTWQKSYIYFDLSYGHWWVPGASTSSSISIYAIAPILRSYLKEFFWGTPFVELSIGFAYLSKTHFNNRNLGMHFSFQDQLGAGASFGKEKQFSASLSALHYSNGSLSSNNSGITVPIILNLSYRF